MENKAVSHGLTDRQKRDGKLKINTGKKPKKLKIEKKELENIDDPGENDVDLDEVPMTFPKHMLPMQGYTVP